MTDATTAEATTRAGTTRTATTRAATSRTATSRTATTRTATTRTAATRTATTRTATGVATWLLLPVVVGIGLTACTVYVPPDPGAAPRGPDVTAAVDSTGPGTAGARSGDPGRPEGPVGVGATAAAPPAPLPTATFAEVRGLWVVRTTLTSPERIREMVGSADRAGFNTLIVQVRGRGDAYYRSSFEPRAEALADQPSTFDPLGLVIEEAHARGMAVHAWLNTHLVASPFGTPSDPRHLTRARPDLLAVPKGLARDLHGTNPWDPAYLAALQRYAGENSDRVEGVYTNPSHPTVQAHVADLWTEIAARYPLDGMHFDYVRYPSPAFDYSRDALERFRGWAAPRVGPERAARLDRARERDPLAWPEALPDGWDDFRRAQITALVERVYRRVKEIRPELVVSAAVFSDPDDARATRFQEWEEWLERGIVDVVAPMAYSPDDGRFRDHVARAVDAAADPRRVWAGIGAWQTGFDGTVRKIGIAREVGAGGVLLFSYDWAASEGRGPRGRSFLDGVGEQSFERGR